MRHLKAGSKLKRDSGSRKALLRNLVTSVIEQERVVTTVTQGQSSEAPHRQDDHPRQAGHAACSPASPPSFLETPKSVKKLFDTLGTRFGQRQGGYTRIVRLGFRKGDGAEQAMIELVGSELVKRACRARQAPRRASQSAARRSRGRRSRVVAGPLGNPPIKGVFFARGFDTPSRNSLTRIISACILVLQI